MFIDFEYIMNQLKTVGVADVFDILIVTFVFFYIFRFVRERRAGKLAIGVVFILVALFLSELFEMRATHFILNGVVNVGLIALLIIFQPELRSMLEKMGGEPLKGIRKKMDKSTAAKYRKSLNDICEAVKVLSDTQTGALIVIEGSTKLGEYIKTGTIIDAEISPFLICNIFYDKAPLHDGALIIRDRRLCAAGCFLPVSTNPDIKKELGTRHRAGIGLSEASDATVIIVSEETGTISVAIDGELKRGFTAEELNVFLDKSLIHENTSVKKRFFGTKNDDGEDADDD